MGQDEYGLVSMGAIFRFMYRAIFQKDCLNLVIVAPDRPNTSKPRYKLEYSTISLITH